METVNIKIAIEVVTHQNVVEHPHVQVLINDKVQFDKIMEHSDIINFKVELEEDQQHKLTIVYDNKSARHDVVLQDGLPIKDKRIEINRISFEDIDLDFFTLSSQDSLSYTTTDPQGENTTGFDATKLSWNGSTILLFESPIYIWILENL